MRYCIAGILVLAAILTVEANPLIALCATAAALVTVYAENTD